MSVESIVVNVATPKGTYQNSFEKTAKVSDVITAAANAKGLGDTTSCSSFTTGKSCSPSTAPW